MLFLGYESSSTRLAKCCFPVLGDQISGILTSGYGLIVHRSNCKKIKEWECWPWKNIPLQWGDSGDSKKEFDTEIEIKCDNRVGFLAKFGIEIASLHSNISYINISESSKKVCLFKIIISVRNKEHLDKILRRLGMLRDVIEIHR